MNGIRFHKFHGTGNDFIMIDNRSGSFLPDPSSISRMCHRRFGIGADGLILLQEDASLDFEMKYYNADGLEGTMCGNGGRCALAFADFLSWTGRKARFTAIDGQHEGEIIRKEEGLWQVGLGMADTPLPVPMAGGYFINTGSPHLVLTVDDVDSVDVVGDGRRLRHDALFRPGGTNVDFVRQTPEGLIVRSYERGVEDETLSCGTGVTAASIVMAFQSAIDSGPTEIRTRGGNLRVHWTRLDERYTGIILEGPAALVYSGETMI